MTDSVDSGDTGARKTQNHLMVEPEARQELAHYYSDWIWDDRSLLRMKSLLLFFDGVALMLPSEHFDRTVDQEPILAQPLLEQGMLHNFTPGNWLTPRIVAKIRDAAYAVTHELAAQAGQRSAPSPQPGRDVTITTAHFTVPVEDTGSIIDQLLSDGVIEGRQSLLGPDMVRLSSPVRSVILFALALAAQASIETHRIRLVGSGQHASRPAWGDEDLYRVFTASTSGVYADVFARDIQDVGIDLSAVPLDEVLDYRRQHGETYRAYARNLRTVVRTLVDEEAVDREELLRDRTEEILDQANTLRRARRDWGRPTAALALSAMGAAWTARQGDGWGSVLAILAALAGFAKPSSPSSAFTYLFDAPSR